MNRLILFFPVTVDDRHVFRSAEFIVWSLSLGNVMKCRKDFFTLYQISKANARRKLKREYGMDTWEMNGGVFLAVRTVIFYINCLRIVGI